MSSATWSMAEIGTVIERLPQRWPLCRTICEIPPDLCIDEEFVHLSHAAVRGVDMGATMDGQLGLGYLFDEHIRSERGCAEAHFAGRGIGPDSRVCHTFVGFVADKDRLIETWGLSKLGARPAQPNLVRRARFDGLDWDEVFAQERTMPFDGEVRDLLRGRVENDRHAAPGKPVGAVDVNV